MRILKFTADRVFDGYDFLDPGTVVITDEEGRINDISDKENAGDDVQHFSGILSPGLVNCHCHLELSHLKNVIPPGTGLVEFVLAVVQRRNLPEPVIFEAIEKAEQEMLQNGIVAVGDICNNTLTIPQKSKSNIWYHNFIEVSGFNPAIASERFAKSENFFREYYTHFNGAKGNSSIVPHAPYSVADPLWEKIIHFPNNNMLTIHNQESESEDEWFMHKTGAFTELYERMGIDTDFFQATGKSSLQTYLPKLLSSQSLILVHNVFTSNEDMAFAHTAGNKIYWCLCAGANQYITGQLPDVEKMMEKNCTIVLGTDSLASNNQLSIVEEMKIIHHHFPGVSIGSILKWATSNGAKALQCDQLFGSLENGKKPGLVIIDNELSAAKRIV